MKKYFFLEKKQYFSLGFVLLFCSGLYFLFQKKEEKLEKKEPTSFVSSEEIAQNATIIEFNPNELDEKQWRGLGFSEKQVATILKYKKVVGGYFSSKAQLKKCYAISEEKFAQLEPFILLPDEASKNYNQKFYSSYKHSEQKEIIISKPFDPNVFSLEDWQKVGFSEKQAETILKYKNMLGGKFGSKEKFKACFVVSEKHYQKLAPYLLLPEKETEPTTKDLKNDKPILVSFDPNSLDEEGWKNLGFSEKQAKSILKYKQNYLKGTFRTLEDLEKNYIIAGRWEELKPYVQFSTNNTSQPSVKQEVISPSKSIETPTIDISSLELNTIKVNELIAFGFSEKNAISLVGFRKSLGGFVNKNQIFEVYGIDREKAEVLIKSIHLNTENVPKYTLVDAPESWLKTHPYFKYFADKIIFYRTSFPKEKKIWKFINVSPEKEEKMKMYIR